MKRVLITGITGYIGSHLAGSLLKTHRVYGLVRKPINTTYIKDIQSKISVLYYDGSYNSVASALEQSRPDIIFHLAAFCSGSHAAEDMEKLIQSNIVFGAYLLEAVASNGRLPIVYAATIASHYRNETYCPQNLYGATKQAFSDLLKYYTDAGLLRAVTLVLSDTYGPGDYRPKVLNKAIRAAKTGEVLSLTDGQQDYDVVYIDDIVRAFEIAGKWILENDWENETFQIYADKPFSLRATVESMIRINQLVLNAKWGARKGTDREIQSTIRVYPRLPGWRPQIDLDEGLKRLVENMA